MTDFGRSEFDLKSAAEEGAWMQIVHPLTGEDLGERDEDGNLTKPSRIKLLGADSFAYEEAVARTVVMRQKEKIPPKNQITDMHIVRAAKRNRKSRADELAAITIEWENIEMEGEPFPCTPANIVRFYSDFPWVAEQAADFFSNRSNFSTSD